MHSNVSANPGSIAENYFLTKSLSVLLSHCSEYLQVIKNEILLRFCFGNMKKSHGMKSGEYDGCSNTVLLKVLHGIYQSVNYPY
jgi:hypothetical protein